MQTDGIIYFLISFCIITAVANIALIAYLIYYDRMYRVDIKRVAGNIAASLIDDYRNELDTLSKQGVNTFARQRYVEICGAFGLPETATDRVTANVWAMIEIARGSNDE